MKNQKRHIQHESRTDTTKFKAFKTMFARWGHYMGYSSRKEFWWAYLFGTLIVLGIIASIIALLILAPNVAMVFTLIAIIYLVGYLVAFIALVMRRLADAGFSRYFGLLLALSLIPTEFNEFYGRIYSYGEIIGTVILISLLILALFPSKYAQTKK